MNNPFFYTSMFGYRCFRFNKVKLGLFKFKLQLKYRTLSWIIHKIVYSKKCQNCNHPLHNHVSYDKDPDKNGVCINFECIDSDNICEDYK